jgi:hypothetical protein
MIEEVESADVPEPLIALKPVCGANGIDLSAIASKIETNLKTDLQLQSDAGLLRKIAESLLTATVFIAAPLLKNHILEIIGQDEHLGEWRKPQGRFEPILQISKDIFIFRGTVPIPSLSGSKFKFVHVNINDQKMEYEGQGSLDDRTEELLPDSWHFFVFKPKREPVVGSWLRSLTTFGPTTFLNKSETKKIIASDFYNILFNHTLASVLPGT